MTHSDDQFQLKHLFAPEITINRAQAQAIYDELHQQGIHHTSEDCGPGGLVHRAMYDQAIRERDEARAFAEMRKEALDALRKYVEGLDR